MIEPNAQAPHWSRQIRLPDNRRGRLTRQLYERVARLSSADELSDPECLNVAHAALRPLRSQDDLREFTQEVEALASMLVNELRRFLWRGGRKSLPLWMQDSIAKTKVCSGVPVNWWGIDHARIANFKMSEAIAASPQYSLLSEAGRYALRFFASTCGTSESNPTRYYDLITSSQRAGITRYDKWPLVLEEIGLLYVDRDGRSNQANIYDVPEAPLKVIA